MDEKKKLEPLVAFSRAMDDWWKKIDLDLPDEAGRSDVRIAAQNLLKESLGREPTSDEVNRLMMVSTDIDLALTD